LNVLFLAYWQNSPYADHAFKGCLVGGVF